ncbi:hypothetical protein Nhal_1806 [Nitrosococcus halophilus Nc 4]|uniref:Uncharacterized protein n=1 Tax=Nitrosococcus halophilus (strain Nc4) TaxID=472759 RepID=D5C335_NITHN|nr:hypothetical protein Nhal_1806 [Nitrosococcus halophilus Nc 4]
MMATLFAENEAHVDRIDEYGVFYRVEGALQDPEGILAVVTIWMRQEANPFYFPCPGISPALSVLGIQRDGSWFSLD